MVLYYLPYRYEPTELLHEYENMRILLVSTEKKEKLFDKLDKIDFTLGKEDKEFLNLPPVLDCGNKKEYNPITKKCVNKCKDDKIRNENFRCVKNKTVKNKK